jgi:hypothetical protein
MKIRNPNFEILNKFEIRNSNAPNGRAGGLAFWNADSFAPREAFGILNLGFCICLGFRASNFGFQALKGRSHG